MLRRLVFASLMSAFLLPAKASPFSQTFGNGILGVPWGAPLTSLVATFPQGDHMFAITPGCRAYWVKDGQPFLGIPREDRGTLFGLDKQNRVAIVSIAFDFSRKDELRSTLISLLGAPMASSRTGEKTQYTWRSPEGMRASVTEFGEASQQIVWLSVATAEYRVTPGAC
jgi:hypothetical protein